MAAEAESEADTRKERKIRARDWVFNPYFKNFNRSGKSPENQDESGSESEEWSGESIMKEKIKKKSEDYKKYINMVLKSIDPELGLSTGAMDIMNSLVTEHLEKLASEAGKLARYSQRGTMGSREIQSAVRLTYPGDLGLHAVSEGKKAVVLFTSMCEDM